MPIYRLSASENIAITGGRSHGFSVTGHNGHTTKLQYVDADGGYHDIPDEDEVIDHTTPHFGTLVNYPGGFVRVDISGGTGDIIFETEARR